jgi:AraC-like DNA-binding protein
LTVTHPGREQVLSKQLLDNLRKAVPFSQGLVVTTMPRGGLQIAQPAHLPESVLKSYNRGVHAEDRAVWRAMTEGQVVRPQSCWESRDFEGSIYYRELLLPLKIRYAVVLPLAAPILDGYPGAVYIGRTDDEGDFTKSEIEALRGVVRQFDEKTTTLHASRREQAVDVDSPLHQRPPVYFVVVDHRGDARLVGADWAGYDNHLRQQMVEQARKRVQHLNGDGQQMDRVLLPDEHGDIWTFRVASYRSYPALGEGAYTFFCLTPTCHEWSAVKPGDFQADQEVSRLIPALKFMQQEFHRGPTLGEISKQVDLSPFHFHRRFTELLGLTPKQYLLECQIHAAKTQLLAATKELVAIARDCGFAHQSHFTSRFKQATGLTPTRWRRMMRERDKVGAK